MSTLTLRRVALTALVAAIAVPLLAGIGTWYGVAAWQAGQRAAKIDTARRLLLAGAGRYELPQWQRATTHRLARLGVGVQIVQPGAGKRSVYTSGSETAALQAAPPKSLSPLGLTSDLPAERGGYVVMVFAPPLDAGSRLVASLLVGIASFAVLLGAGALLLRRWLVAPLVVLGRHLDGVGDEATAPPMPPSRIREIAVVTGALDNMRRSLRAAAARDASREEERRFLISAIAHDLRTPLFMLRGYLERIGRTELSANSDLPRAQERAARIDRLIGDLSAFSSLDLKRLDPARAPIDLGQLLEKSAAEFTASAETKGISVSLSGPRELVVAADEFAISRVVSNLLDNAVRHTPPGGRIEIEWKHDNGCASFAVRDSGDGIDADDLPHLFEPLYRGDASRNSASGGSGLGLAIAQRLIEAHNGTITAVNRPGSGVEFVATIRP